MTDRHEGRPNEVLLPETWPRPSGYANGIAAEGRSLHVAGQIGWDPVSLVLRDGLVAQTDQALRNIVAVLEAGGASPAHVVRLTWYLTDLAAYRESTTEIGRCFRAIFGRHYPAMSLLQVTALLEPGAVVEIEATAVIPHGEA